MSIDINDKKVAIVYDWIDKWGGVERVLLNLAEVFPEADFYTSYYDEKKALWAKNLNIKTSFIQKLPKIIRGCRLASLPFYPFAFESFNFNDYDLVISVSSSYAKSVITKPGTLHVCYLLTPTRFLWLYPELYLKNWMRKLGSCYFNHLKDWDYVVAQRPDKIISISKTVSDRCFKFYKRQSEVVYPGFDINYWENVQRSTSNVKRPTFNVQRSTINAQRSTSNVQLSTFNVKRLTLNYYLIVSRLEPYKKVDLAVNVFNKHKDLNLIIVGEGSEANKLKKEAGENIKFLGRVSDQELARLYSEAEALIMPQEEDFGYVSLEAQFFGCPVIAYKLGGAAETIIENKTGIFFDKQTESSLGQAIERFSKIKYNLRTNISKYGIESVKRFSKEKFIKSFQMSFRP